MLYIVESECVHNMCQHSMVNGLGHAHTHMVVIVSAHGGEVALHTTCTMG